MSDNLRRYRAIRDALCQGYPGQPTGTVTRHLTTLAALMSGIVGSQRTHLPHIATQVPDDTKPESRVKRLARWMQNNHVTEDVYFVPYAEVLLQHLALQTVGVLVLPRRPYAVARVQFERPIVNFLRQGNCGFNDHFGPSKKVNP